MAPRSPPRLSRCRWTRPLLAGIGGDAAQVGEGGFGGDPVGIVAGAGEELAGDLGPDAGQGEQGWGDLGADQLVELVVGVGDLFGQLLVAAGESAQRGLGGMLGVAELLTGTQPGAGRDHHRGAAGGAAAHAAAAGPVTIKALI